jgi:hypothetical protein
MAQRPPRPDAATPGETIPNWRPAEPPRPGAPRARRSSLVSSRSRRGEDERAAAAWCRSDAVSVRICRRNGSPVRGARVDLHGEGGPPRRCSLAPRRWGRSDLDARPRRRGHSDRQGVVHFGRLPPGRYLLDVLCAGVGAVYGRELWVSGAERSDPAPIPELVLDCGGEVRLQVLFDGEPLVGEELWLRSRPGGPWVTAPRRTEADGLLRATGLGPGELCLECTDVLRWPTPEAVRVRPAAGAADLQQIELFDRADLQLRVLDRRGRPAPRARLGLEPVGLGLARAVGEGGLEAWLADGRVGSTTGSEHTDVRGELLLSGLPAVPLRWSLELEGQLSRGVWAPAPRRATEIALRLP